MSRRRPPADLFRDLVIRLRALLSFDSLTLALYDPARKIMEMYLWEGTHRLRQPVEIGVGESAVGSVWRNQNLLSIGDLTTEKQFEPELRWLRAAEIRSYRVLPLTILQRRLGALGFGSKRASGFSFGNLPFLRLIADIVALCVDANLPEAALLEEKARLRLVIERAHTEKEAQPAARTQLLLMSKPPEPSEEGNRVWFGSAEALFESEPLMTAYLSAYKVGLCILDTNFRYLSINRTMAEMNGIPPEMHLGKSIREMLGDFAELIEPQLSRALATAQPILNFQISCKLPTRDEPGHWLEQYIPIKDAAGKVAQIGVVATEITESKKLEDSLRGVSQTLREERKRQEMLLEIGRALTGKWDVRHVFPKISAYLRRVLRQEYAALALRDEKTGHLVREAVDFPLGRNLRAGGEISTARSSGVKAVQERSSLILTRDEIQGSDPAIAASLTEEGLRSLCCVPLLRPKAAVGVLVLGSTRAGAFKTDDLTLLNQVAAQLAIAIENARTAREVQQLRNQLEQDRRNLEGEPRAQFHFEEIIGESAALERVLDQVGVVAESDATVLLLGETGTGKGLIARAIHRISKRKDKNFVTLNCAAIPTGLLESELFGHEKGAFTGAVSQKVGRLELADKGTLFLDEIGEIPLELQPKLLRVLQDHEFERLGGTRTIKVDLRLIAATNRDLAKSVAEKEFRSDLFYRFNVFPIRMPSLRERREDIPLLVRYFVRKFAQAMNRGIETIPTETMQALINWHWPGNVRELENFIERSVILTDGTALRAPLSELRTQTFVAEHSLKGTEREHIIRVLRETRGKISGPAGAARRLGLKRSTLQSKMQRLGISRADYSGEKSA
ncbi:MAG: sigma 54-interacting transcriptional regulator [Candidatus Sulfotelmatobacter sp.]